MDNRITKRRLSDFLAYEWILIIIVAVVAMVVWELAYTIGSVRLTPGQQFKFYYDQSLSSSGMGKLFSVLDDDVFSYDVLSLDSEALTSEYNVLSIRLSVQEGDIVVTDCKEPAEDATNKTIRAKTIVDNMYGYSYQKMLGDAKTYLRDEFLKDSLKTGDDAAQKELAKVYDNLDEDKIDAHFRKRMIKDNRFRTEVQKKEGVELEKARIKKLCNEVCDFEKLLALETQNPDLFFKYTKYEQMVASATTEDNKAMYQKLVDKEVNEGRANAIYGLKVAALKDSDVNVGKAKINPTEYFKMSGADNAENIVILAFDFWENFQYDLQFECISFINTIVRQCSDILDA
jgi:hypothetical protein